MDAADRLRATNKLGLTCGGRDFVALAQPGSDGWRLSLRSESEQVVLSFDGRFPTLHEAIVEAMLRVQTESAAASTTNVAEPSALHSIGDLVKKTIAEAKDGYEHPERH